MTMFNMAIGDLLYSLSTRYVCLECGCAIKLTSNDELVYYKVKKVKNDGE